MHAEKFYQPHMETKKGVVTSKYSRKTDPSKIARTDTIKNSRLCFIETVMRTNGKCNNAHAP